MEKKLPCDRHEEQIKSLNKRVDDMDDIRGVLHSLDKSYVLQSQILKEMSERNDRQDKRMDEQDIRMGEYQDVMVKVSTNLTELAEGQRLLNKSHKELGNEVSELKVKVDESEEKSIIDLRDIEKMKYTDILFRYALPAGGAIIILLELLRIWKG